MKIPKIKIVGRRKSTGRLKKSPKGFKELKAKPRNGKTKMKEAKDWEIVSFK